MVLSSGSHAHCFVSLVVAMKNHKISGFKSMCYVILEVRCPGSRSQADHAFSEGCRGELFYALLIVAAM